MLLLELDRTIEVATEKDKENLKDSVNIVDNVDNLKEKEIPGEMQKEVSMNGKIRPLSSETTNRLKLLFRSKVAQNMLKTYELGGWMDHNSRPVRNTRRSICLPTQSGGPLIICLDTSWSMTGPRETLAKAVVVQCASTAFKQGRAVYVLAFSGQNDLAECELLLQTARGANRAGIHIYQHTNTYKYIHIYIHTSQAYLGYYCFWKWGLAAVPMSLGRFVGL